jgi:hypothetical protein
VGDKTGNYNKSGTSAVDLPSLLILQKRIGFYIEM